MVWDAGGAGLVLVVLGAVSKTQLQTRVEEETTSTWTLLQL